MQDTVVNTVKEIGRHGFGGLREEVSPISLTLSWSLLFLSSSLSLLFSSSLPRTSPTNFSDVLGEEDDKLSPYLMAPSRRASSVSKVSDVVSFLLYLFLWIDKLELYMHVDGSRGRLQRQWKGRCIAWIRKESVSTEVFLFILILERHH